MNPAVLLALMAGVLVFNFLLWKRRGRGWRRHVDDFIAVLAPRVPEPVVDVVVLQPAGAVGRQARAEQGRGLRAIVGGMSGEIIGAVAEHRAGEEADAEAELPPMWALALSSGRRYLLPVALLDGAWSAGAVERSWAAGDATYSTSARSLTIQVTVTLTDGSWTGAFETARDPAGYAQSILDRLKAAG